MSSLRNRLVDLRRKISSLLYSLAAITAALIVSGLLLVIFGYEVQSALYHLFDGAFGSLYNLGQTLQQATPLLFAGLAVALAFRSGLFNIGVEGQLYWGALASALVGIWFSFLPMVMLLPVTFLAGAAAGGIWGFIPGYLKAKTGAHEVITTIMLNEIAILATTFLTASYFKVEGPVDQTARLSEAALLPELPLLNEASLGIVAGILVIILSYFLLRRTSLGFDLQAVGKNSDAAEYGGIDSKKMLILAMVLSGAVGGLAGSTVIMGELERFVTHFSPGYGFTGIAVAVLGRNHPVGVLLAALLFGALEAGGMSMQLFTDIPTDLIEVVQGLVILFVAAPGFIRLLQRFTGKEAGERA